MSLDLDGVLGQHEILPGFRDLSIHCGCGWVGPERHGLPTHRSHVAAALRAEVGRWLGSEGAVERMYRSLADDGWADHYRCGWEGDQPPDDGTCGKESVERESIAAALAALAEQVAQVAPSRVPGEES